MELFPNITDFSHELLCQILKYLPLREILSVAMLCKKMATAVDMHLRLCKSIDFCQDSICGYMPSTITDDHLLILLRKCPHLETVYGLHPVKIERRRLRKRSALTIPGIIEALSLCFHLKAIETSDLRLFEAIMQHLPHIEIIGHFQNRDGLFPPQASQRLKLQPYPRISSLHLIGVEVPELTAMPHLQHLHLQCVRFTKLQPFRAFLAQNLKSFVMKHCIGPSVPQRYLSLIIALSSSPNLNHLELVRVPLLNGLFQRAVEDSYRHNGFVNLRTLVISGCKGVLEADLGHLMIVSSKNLETLYIQPSLTKDSLFVSLSYAQCIFPRLQNLHIGYIDTLNSSGEWSNDALLSLGLAEVPDTPSSITDSGMKVISELFPHIKTMSVSNCPHLMVMYHWMSPEDDEAWSRLTDLTLQKCHCLQLSSFAMFIAFLSNIEVVILNDMFREPPKGCSHVGLSAGTGLGMSSAVVSNQDEHIAVQGHHQDFEHPGDEENEENEREFIDVENEEPHFMVLQRDFFDGEEEEEDDDGVDAALDDQDPAVIRQRLNSEEHSGVEDCVNDNSLQNNDSSKVNENNFCIYEPSTSGGEKDMSGSSSVLPSDAKNVAANESNCHSSQSSKSSLPSVKSVHVQCSTLPEECYQSSNSDMKNVKKSSFHNNDMSDDSYKSDDDIKICVCSKLSDFNYDEDYDPHKPSTSRAGRHLDYSVPCNTKSFNASNSETDHYNEFGRDTERSKESLNIQKVSKTKVETLDSTDLPTITDCSLKSDVNDYLHGIKNDNIRNKISNTSVSQNHLNNLSSSQDEMCLLKPCVVLLSRLDTSNNCTQKSNVILDHERYSSQNEAPGLVSYSSLGKEGKIFSESDAYECLSPGISVRHNDCAKDQIEKSLEDSKFNDFKHKKDSLVENSKNSVEEKNSLKIENVSENMCSIFIEKLDKTYCNATVENCVESIELSGDSSLRDSDETPKICSFDSLADEKEDPLGNIPMESDEIPKCFEDFWQESIREDNYEHMEIEKCCNSIDKTEEESSHCCGKGSYVTNENASMYNSLNSPVLSNLQRECGVTEFCSEIHAHCVLPCKNASGSKEASSLYCKPPDKEISSLEMGPDKLQQTEDVFKVTLEGEINENEVHKTDTNGDIQSLDTVGHVTSSKAEVSLEFSTSAKVSKLQNGEFYKTPEKQNSFKIESREDSGTEKKSYGCPVISHSETDLLSNDKKNSNCSIIPENASKKTHSKCSRMYDTSQPSTSKDSNDYDSQHVEGTVEPTGSVKKAKSLKSTKNGKSVLLSRKRANSSQKITHVENESSSCNTSTIQVMKSSIKDEIPSDENSENESELSPPVVKRMKRTYGDNDDSKYYVQVLGTSADIINSLTGESYSIPTCSVLLSEWDNETSDLHLSSKIRTRYRKFNSNKDSSMSRNFSPCMPSVSEENQCDSVMETCKLGTESRVNCSQKCVASGRRLGKTYSVRPKRRAKSSSKIVEDEKQDNKEDYKNENESSKKCFCKCCRNICDQLSGISSSSKVGTEKLKISNSDAAVFIRNRNEENMQMKLHVESKCYRENIDVNKLENDPCSNQKAKTESKAGSIDFSKNDSSYQNNADSKSGISVSNETSVTYHNGRRTRKKKVSSSQKQGKKVQKNSFVLSDRFSKSTRSCSKKIPSVPTVCLISQGTQANSADIRRSVRRIRRATARARRSVPSMRVPRNSTHSNKISAKVLNKKPVNMNPRPEMHDKATSTSDPLLEDDAVQTLQLTSKTLLSFTVVSCGISDIIIDHCPKLFHVEVQACRILKKFHLNYCPAMKRLNVSQCPKLSICALASPVMAVEPDSYFLVSYEPCMQGYHPGEGEKAILSRTHLNQSVLICHDISSISHEGFQAVFKEKLIEWFRYLSKVHAVLKPKTTTASKECEVPDCCEYPWSHDLRRIHGKYTYLPSSDFCHTDGRYQLLTNYSIFCDVYETHQLDAGFPAISDCDAHRDISLISHEAREKSAKMENKFIGFYIPITENSQINF